MEKDLNVQPYGEIKQLAPNLYVLDGEWYDTDFARRMTIVRLSTGKLFIHNAIRLLDGDYAKIEALGEVEWIVAPNYLHGSEAHAYKRRYPEAKLYLPEKKLREWGNRTPVDGVLPGEWPSDVGAEIECFRPDGMRYIDESVFFHKDSRTLIVTDLVFNMQNEPKGFSKVIYLLNRVYRRFGPSRFFKYAAIADRGAFRAGMARILEWDFDRVIMNHGQVLERGGKVKFRESFTEMGLLD